MPLAMMPCEALWIVVAARRIERPECEPPPMVRRSVSLADDAHLAGRHAQPFGGELREAGGMALARGERADHDLDAAVGPHRHLGALVRRAALEFDVAGEAEAAPQAARPRPARRAS